MPRSPFLSFSRCARAVLTAALLLPSAQAAELGDIAVRSHIGQQLSADIELVLLTPDEVDQLQARLAGPDIYKGANVRMNPALASLRMSVVRRDGRHFLHLTTFQPVQTELLHLFVELVGSKQSNVRAATLWLTPDPTPAAPERSAAVPVPASAPLAAPSAAAAPSGNTPSEAAVAAARARLAARDAALLPPPAAATPLPSPAAAPPAATRATPPASVPVARVKPAEAAPVAAIPGPAMPPAAGACTPRQLNEKLKQCVALDEKNAALSSKLVELEDKVKLLQAALQAQPAAPVAAAAALASAAAKPGAVIPPSPAALKAAEAKAKAKEKKGGINTMTKIAAGSVALLLAIGVAVHFLRRKKAKKSSGPLQIWQSWRKKKAAPQPEAPAEPSLNAD